jgi:stage V sporulation protein D (sporulation-specific penicillin-binding protein)
MLREKFRFKKSFSGRSIHRPFQIRVSFLLSFLLLWAIAIVVNLVKIQVVLAGKYSKLAQEGRIRTRKILASRGTIYDRNGQPLAINIEANTVCATPYLVKHPLRVSKLLAPILGIPRKTIYRKIKGKTGFAYIARQISKRQANQIRKLEKKLPHGLEGVKLISESKRVYPWGDLAAQVVGFTDIDNKGIAGIEFYYDKRLSGLDGKKVQEEDIYGRPIPGGYFKYKPAVSGKPLFLTLDAQIQYQAQALLNEAIKEQQAKSGSVIVMNPKNGEIYALANWPTFNLNNRSEFSFEATANRAISRIYEPGSTMKVITASSALEEGLSPRASFFLPSVLVVGGWKIHDSHPRSPTTMSISEIVVHSSNIGAALVANKLSKTSFYNHIVKFGLVSKTGIDLPGEVSGMIPTPNQWSSSTAATIAFGQGISITPIEMLRAVSAIANQGRLVRPHLLKEISDSKANRYQFDKQRDLPTRDKSGLLDSQVVSNSTVKSMKEILVKVVEEGTGKEAQVPGYQVAGKTGTAQVPRRDAAGYSPGKYIASFIGFLPANDPKLAIFVSIEEPKKSIYGGVVAAPVFSKLAQFSLQRLKVTP